MNINLYRKGNIVHSSGCLYVIDKLYFDSESKEVKIIMTHDSLTDRGSKSHTIVTFLSEIIIEPVILTQDSLILFGYAHYADPYSNFPFNQFTNKQGGKRTKIIYHFEEKFRGLWLCSKEGNTELKYFHQLQNAYFLETGEELIFQL